MVFFCDVKPLYTKSTNQKLQFKRTAVEIQYRRLKLSKNINIDQYMVVKTIRYTSLWIKSRTVLYAVFFLLLLLFGSYWGRTPTGISYSHCAAALRLGSLAGTFLGTAEKW